ncbi:CopD family protein [Pseudomonas aeruginosa]|uniref:CopD family protein n=1 Tax=Pseudomonas aeruginosa TaxID=287 RepID=UPI003D156BD0
MSGILNYLLIAGPSFDPLISTLYGRLLMVKLLLFAGMLALGCCQSVSVEPEPGGSFEGRQSRTGSHQA